MKCNRCGKEIDELEIFCDDCKRHLKNFSSRSDVEELEELIENQKKLTDLENTKELVNLDKLVEEELVKEEPIEEKTQIFEMNNESKKIIPENQNEELSTEFADEEKQDKKKNKKKLIVIVSVILGILVIASIILFIFLGREEKEEESNVVIDYEKVINSYGDSVIDVVKDYISKNEDIPTWQYVIENVEYDRYEIECLNHIIYTDGNVYLSECKVNDKTTKYTYGEEQEEIKEGKSITIYKEDYDGYSVYYGESTKNSVETGTVTCKTEECSYISAFNQFVLISEESEYYLYDYTNNSINFGPFLLDNEYDVLVYNNELYGILYKEKNQNNIYNVKTGKILKNIKGYLLPGDMGLDPTITYKYNYAILVDNNKNNFVNLKTGNVSYTIKENIIEFIENKSKKIVYIITNTDNNKYKIYNSTGKTLFDGKEYSQYILDSNNLVSTETNFKVYDSDLKLKTESKIYDQILGLYKDFVVAVKDNDLIILSIEDEVYTTFEDIWDKNNNIFHYNLSKKDNDRITLIVENKKIPYGTQGNCVEYYYTISTSESGYIEKISVE